MHEKSQISTTKGNGGPILNETYNSPEVRQKVAAMPTEEDALDQYEVSLSSGELYDSDCSDDENDSDTEHNSEYILMTSVSNLRLREALNLPSKIQKTISNVNKCNNPSSSNDNELKKDGNSETFLSLDETKIF